jgi:hypothetical protein
LAARHIHALSSAKKSERKIPNQFSQSVQSLTNFNLEQSTFYIMTQSNNCTGFPSQSMTTNSNSTTSTPPVTTRQEQGDSIMSMLMLATTRMTRSNQPNHHNSTRMNFQDPEARRRHLQETIDAVIRLLEEDDDLLFF